MANRKKPIGHNRRLEVVQRKSGSSSKRASSLGKVTVREKKPSNEPPSLLGFTLAVLYRNLYLLGITLLRKRLRLVRRVRGMRMRVRTDVRRSVVRIRNGMVRFGRRVTGRFRAPFTRIYTIRQELRPLIEEKKKLGEPTLTLRLDMALPVLRLVGKVVATILNYTLPVIALYALLVIIGNQISRPWGLMVTYDGVELGYVESESVYESALQDVRTRIITGSDAEMASYVTGSVRFTLTEVHEDQLISSDALANNIIQAHGGDIEQAYGLYINDQFYGAVTERERLLEELRALLEAGRVAHVNATPEFEKSIRFNPGLYPLESVKPIEELSSLIHSMEAYDEYYIVVDGDTPTGIADKVGVAYVRIKEMNPDIEEGIRAGDQILTAVARPFLSVKNTYTEIYEEEYDYEVIETENSTYAVGYRKVTQEGEPGRRLVTAEVTTINGLVTSTQIVDTEILEEAIPERVTVGVNMPRQGVSPGSPSGGSSSDRNSGGFIWPTSGGYVSSGLYGYPGHTGMDIAGPGAGAPIYAAASGTVITSRATWVGYGHYIVIDHGNGYQTWYAHNSALYANVGDYVEQGQIIALMGRTGNASGNHLHFEVRYNGRVLNPADFIGR